MRGAFLTLLTKGVKMFPERRKILSQLTAERHASARSHDPESFDRYMSERLAKVRETTLAQNERYVKFIGWTPHD